MLNKSLFPSGFKFFQPSTWMRTAVPKGDSTRLERHHIYILPTRFGWLFAVLLITLLIGSINYTISLGFALTFLLAGFGAISMHYTWRNLAHLRIRFHQAQPVFAGTEATFTCLITEHNHRARFAIAVQFSEKNSFHLSSATHHTNSMIDIAADSDMLFNLSMPTRQRGWLVMPRVRLATEFPVSFFHVWAFASIDAQCLIYPTPAEKSRVNLSLDATGTTGDQRTPQGDDDFAGHRDYQFGDSPKRIDWKASSREQGMLTKQFHGEAISTRWFDWEATDGDFEARISEMTRWVVDAEAAHLDYGLRLPTRTIKPNHGASHYMQCLTALALM